MVDRKIIVALDTNIFISIINKESDYDQAKQILDWIDEGKVSGIVSTIILAEICSGYELTGDSSASDEFLAHLIGSSNYEIVDVNVQVALEAGNLHAKRKWRLPDALIVASAVRHRAEFLISNDDDLMMGKTSVDNLKVLSASEFVKIFKQKEDEPKNASTIKKRK